MSVESAYPDRLIAYASTAKASTNSLRGPASRLSAAIQAFNASHPDPQVISSVPDVGSELTAYAGQKSQIDQWVHDVGVAFLTADSGHPSKQVHLSDGPGPIPIGPNRDKNPLGPLPVAGPVTIPQVVAQQKLAKRQKLLQREQDCTAPGQVGPLGYKGPLPSNPNAPRAEALPPGALQAATQQNERKRQFWNWMGGGSLPDDPHTPESFDPWRDKQTDTFGGPVPAQYPPDATDGE